MFPTGLNARQRLRILLVQPGYCDGIGFRLAALPEPLHLELIAATVPEHEVRILDMRLDPDLDAALNSFAPDLVGITALTTEVHAALDVVRRVRGFSPEIFIIAGGHHASLLPQDFQVPEVDAIAIGEGEQVFAQLVRSLPGRTGLADLPSLIWRNGDGFVRNPPATARLNMDLLPLPRRDLTSAYRQHYSFMCHQPDTSVATSRGCPYRCSFCSVWEFYGGRTSQMSPQRVMRELAEIHTEHVTFVDDNFLMNSRREDQIADMIRAEGLKMRFGMECRTDSIARHPELVSKWVQIGLSGVLLGLEGAGDNTLEKVNKRNTTATNERAIRILHDHGVVIWGAFIVDPDWTEDKFKQLREYVDRHEITHTQFTVLTPLPGTQLYRERYHELLTHDYTCFDTMHSVLPTRLPREVFYQQFAGLYRQTNLGPYYDLVRAGRLTIDECRRGKTLLDRMSNWELYVQNDPVLRQRQACPAGAS
jgi:hopanoid C-3 methylase